MASLWTDDFEDSYSDNTAGKWDNLYDNGPSAGGLYFQGTIVQDGVGSLRAYSTSWTFWRCLERTFTTAPTEAYAGFWLRWDSGQAFSENNNSSAIGIFALLSSTGDSQISLGIEKTTHVLQVFRGTMNDNNLLGATATALASDTWYYVELYAKIHDTAGAITVRIDTVEELALASIDTNKAGGDIKKIRLGIIHTGGLIYKGSAADLYFDNFAMNDTTGGVDDSWPAPSAPPDTDTILRLTQDTTVHTLTGDGAIFAGCTYVPRTPTLPDDFDHSDYEALYNLSVTESATVVLVGTAADILAQIRAIEAMFPVGNRLRQRSTQRLFVEYQPQGGDAVYRSEVLAGRLELPDDALTPRLLSGAVEILVAWTRRGWWEGPEGELPIYSISTATTQTGGSIALNYGGTGLFAAGSAVAGVVPAPVRLEMTNNNGASVSFRRFFLSLNVFADPTEQRDSNYHIVEGEDATGVGYGGSDIYDANSRGAYYKQIAWTGAISHTNFMNFTLSAAQLASFGGGRFRVMARFAVAPAANTYVKLTLKIPAGATPLTTIWESGEILLSSLYLLQDLGTIPLPPLGLSAVNDMALILSVRSAATGTLNVDFLAFLATDAMHTFEQIGYQIPANDKIIADGIDRRAVYYQSSGGSQLPIYSDNPPHLHLWPERDQSVEILFEEGTGMTVTRGLLVRAYYRPRRLTV